MITPSTLSAVELNSLRDQENNHSLNWLVLTLASLAGLQKSEASEDNYWEKISWPHERYADPSRAGVLPTCRRGNGSGSIEHFLCRNQRLLVLAVKR
jgi:hypothetical protein